MLRRSVRLIYPVKNFYSLQVSSPTSLCKVFYSTYDKEFPNPSLPTPQSKVHSPDTDILLEQIRKAKTIERVLELTSLHLDVMNAKHIVSTMRSIHDLAKDPSFSNTALMENEIFQSLCARLMKSVRLLEPSEVIGVYKALSSLGIRNNTYVMQSVLKMLGSQINNMTLGQLTFLHFLLSKQKPNSLVDGLKLALPLVLQVQIEQQLDSDNVSEIISCMQIACKSRLRPSILEKVIRALLDKANMIAPTDAVSILFALMNCDTPVDGYNSLLRFCFELISKNKESINPKQTLSILRLCKTNKFYDSRFFFAMVEKIVAEEWSIEHTYDTTNCFYTSKFAPQFFLDYFVNTLCSDAQTFKSTAFYSPLKVVEYLCLTGYRPARLEEAVEMLCSCEDKISKLSDKLYFKFVCCIAKLGVFPRDHLQKVLDENYLFDAWSVSKKQGQSYEFENLLLCLLWSLKAYDQEETYKFPPAVIRKLVADMSQKHGEYQSPLENFIQNGLGGPQFLQNGLLTTEGIFIDHVLAMRSGNYPVALQPSKNADSPPLDFNRAKFVEELKLPDDAKVIGIIVAEENKYCKDPEVLLGYMNLQIKCLKKKQYYPVIVNYSNFKLLPDREKIPFLMCEIKQAVEEDNMNKASSLT